VRFSFFKSIKTKLFLAITGFLTIVLFSSVFIYYKITCDTLFKKDLTEIKTSSIILANQLGRHFPTDKKELQEILQFILIDYKRVYRVTTFDYKTTVLASTLKSEIGTRTGLKDHLQVLKNGEISIETYRGKDAETFARTIVPIFSHSHKGEKTILGGMEIVFHLEEFDKAVSKMKKVFAVVLIGFLGLAVSAAFFISNRITKPLLTLRDGLSKISKSNLKTQLLIDRKDEFGEITEVFNEMISDLNELTKLKVFTSELQYSEDVLKEYAEKLRQSNKELQDFIYIASHDLQEPLRKIITFGDRIKSKFSNVLDNQGLDYLERMQNAASRMQTLINDLLMYSRITTNAKPFEPVNLNSVVSDVLLNLEVHIEQGKGRVEVGDLPIIEADIFQIRQLLQNLISNALKFHRKEEAPFVKIYSHRITAQQQISDGNCTDDKLCQIIVEDNGIGFDEKYLDRIFGIFQRLQGRSDYEGTGIGLAICRKIVERHNGSITAKSNPGQGAKFIVTLPIKQSKGGIG
jgi:signal transduction histidine kinase